MSSQLRTGQAQPVGDGQGVAHHPLGVVAGLVLARVERGHQRPERGVVGGLEVEERLAQLGGLLAHRSLQAAAVALPGQLDPAPGEGALDGADEVGRPWAA